MTTLARTTIVGIAIPWVWAFGVATAQDPVQGVVFDSKGKPIEAVEVSIWAMGKSDPLQTAKTNANGQYAIPKKIKEPFDVAFTHSKYEIEVVPQLSPDRHQCISKILYLRGEQRDLGSAHDHVMGVERLIVLLGSVGRDQRKAVFEFFQQREVNLYEIARTPVGVESFPQDLRVLFTEKERSLGVLLKQIGP